jgi:hypothetical protein
VLVRCPLIGVEITRKIRLGGFRTRRLYTVTIRASLTKKKGNLAYKYSGR